MSNRRAAPGKKYGNSENTKSGTKTYIERSDRRTALNTQLRRIAGAQCGAKDNSLVWHRSTEQLQPSALAIYRGVRGSTEASLARGCNGSVEGRRGGRDHRVLRRSGGIAWHKSGRHAGGGHHARLYPAAKSG